MDSAAECVGQTQGQSFQIPAKFHPSRSYAFPVRIFGSKGEKRSFRAEWCAKYDWLHYDCVADAAFCYLCMTAEHEKKFLASTKRDPAFINRGYTNWKDATTAFSTLLASRCHKEAVEALELSKQTSDVGEKLSTEHKQQKAENRAMFRKILQNLRFLARQGLSLRGTEMVLTATLPSCCAYELSTHLLCCLGWRRKQIDTCQVTSRMSVCRSWP